MTSMLDTVSNERMPQTSLCPQSRFSVSSVLRFSLRAVALAAILTTGATLPSSAQDAPRAKALSKRVLCMCGGCEDSVGMCNHPGGTFSGPCETARAMQKDLDAHVTRGESDDQILQAMVEQYGPQSSSSRPKKVSIC